MSAMSIAGRMKKAFIVAVNVPEWPKNLQILFPRMSRGELTISLIIIALITTIAYIVIRTLPYISLVKLRT